MGQGVELGSSAQIWHVIRGRGLAIDLRGAGRRGGVTPVLGCWVSGWSIH